MKLTKLKHPIKIHFKAKIKRDNISQAAIKAVRRLNQYENIIRGKSNKFDESCDICKHFRNRLTLNCYRCPFAVYPRFNHNVPCGPSIIRYDLATDCVSVNKTEVVTHYVKLRVGLIEWCKYHNIDIYVPQLEEEYERYIGEKYVS